MLRGLRTASSGWIGKIVMAIVVFGLSAIFALWGIGDIFRGVTRNAVATVGGTWLFGGTKISVDQFQRLYNERLQQFSQQVRRPLTPDEARAIGLDRQVLRQWIEDTTLDQRAKSMRLGISDAAVAQNVTDNPLFRDASGQFDPARFQIFLQRISNSEQGYIAEQRRETLRRQLATAVSSEVTSPKTIAEAIDHFQNEQREADYVMLTAAQAGDVPPPAADALAKYFDERKALYRAPEFRAAVILPLTADEIGRSIEVSADEAKAYFDKHPEKYSVPERREIQQILFADKDAAHKAADRLAGGLAFDDLVKEPDIKDKLQNLGLVPKFGMPDQKVADVAFGLTSGQTSGAIDELYVSTIVHVGKIEPGSAKTLAEVEGDIKKGIAQERATAEIRKMRDKVDDEIGGGARLADIADKLKLPFRAIAAIDRSGRDPDGKPVDLPKGADLLDGIFSTQKGLENDPLQTQDGGIIWYEVTGVTESHERSLDEVKDKVVARWREDEVASRLTQKAAEIVDKVKGGTALAEVAAADKIKLEHTPWVKRRDASAHLPPSLLLGLFRTPKGEVGNVEATGPTDRIVFVVTAITVPPFDPAAAGAKQADEAIRNGMANDLFAQFVAQIENDIGVRIDQDALAEAIGAKQQPQ
jgi:peptidyl-prolyl cis-trans isomerase D